MNNNEATKNIKIGKSIELKNKKELARKLSIAGIGNNRKKMYMHIAFALAFILFVLLAAQFLPEELIRSSISRKNLTPSLSHPFGTDRLGRDMFVRTVKGLRLSIYIGLVTSMISVALALFLSGLSALGGRMAHEFVGFLIDLFIGMPHLVFMVLLAFLTGGGQKGIILAVGVTHWTTLARVMQAELMRLKSENYIAISARMGKSRFRIFMDHTLPHLIPITCVGFLTLFPHVILHEAALTFLGFGLSPQTPAMGIILSEGMGNISTGRWWLILLPAIMLVILIKSFDGIGDKLDSLLDPAKSQE